MAMFKNGQVYKAEVDLITKLKFGRMVSVRFIIDEKSVEKVMGEKTLEMYKKHHIIIEEGEFVNVTIQMLGGVTPLICGIDKYE